MNLEKKTLKQTMREMIASALNSQESQSVTLARGLNVRVKSGDDRLELLVFREAGKKASSIEVKTVLKAAGRTWLEPMVLEGVKNSPWWVVEQTEEETVSQFIEQQRTVSQAREEYKNDARGRLIDRLVQKLLEQNKTHPSNFEIHAELFREGLEQLSETQLAARAVEIERTP